MNIAQQLHRENRNLYDLHQKANLYCYPWINNIRGQKDIIFTFQDSSKLRIRADDMGLLIWAGVE